MSKFKKLLCVMMSIFTVLPAISVFALAETSEDGYLTYEIENGEAKITDCDESISGDYTIPDTLGGYPVTSIDSFAFSRCKSLESINIPDGVTSIHCGAFSNCTSLENIVIPDSVTSIGDTSGIEVFDNTAYYNDESNWEDGVLYIGNYLIEADKSISGSYEIKKGTTVIADFAFSDCITLTSVTIPDSVTAIGRRAFYYCSCLEKVVIQEGVTSISFGAFCGCTYLTSVTIPDSVTEIGEDAFAFCAFTSITIPESVTLIDKTAFAQCKSLTSITIPDSVTSIGDDAFYNTGYYNNKSNWEDDVLYIGNHLIEADDDLSDNYEIKDGTKTIASKAFSFCKSLKRITIPYSVISIGDGAFSCASLIAIYGYTGTEAETYAANNDIPFISLGSTPAVTQATTENTPAAAQATTRSAEAEDESQFESVDEPSGAFSSVLIVFIVLMIVIAAVAVVIVLVTTNRKN